MSSKSQSHLTSGILICILGAVCFSTKAIFVKLAYRDTSIDSVTLLALRMIFSLPFFVVSAYASSSQEHNVRFTGKQWIMVAVIGCLGYYVSSLLDFLGLQYISAGTERLILFIYPTLVLIMSSIFFKIKISLIQWLAVGITYVGLALAFFGELDLGSTHTADFFLGSILIFVCAITYAAYIVRLPIITEEQGGACCNLRQPQPIGSPSLVLDLRRSTFVHSS